jgi:hypothetical protein
LECYDVILQFAAKESSTSLADVLDQGAPVRSSQRQNDIEARLHHSTLRLSVGFLFILMKSKKRNLNLFIYIFVY